MVKSIRKKEIIGSVDRPIEYGHKLYDVARCVNTSTQKLDFREYLIHLKRSIQSHHLETAIIASVRVHALSLNET